MTKEVRSHSGAVAAQEGDKVVGYGAVFNSRSQDLGGFYEEISPEAFNRTLAHGGDLVVTFNHNVNQLLGRTSAGTASVFADDVGLRYEVQVNAKTSVGRDVLAMAERGDIRGSSFTFQTVAGGSEWRAEDGERIRRLTEVRLYELGPVVNPAYLDTTAAVRSLDEWLTDDKEEDAEEETRESTLPPSWRRPISFHLL